MNRASLEQSVAAGPGASSLASENTHLDRDEKLDVEAPRPESPDSLAVEQGIGVTKIEALCEYPPCSF